MRHKSGAVPEVAEYIAKWPVTKEFTRLLDEMLDFLVPQYIKEGKSQFVIAVGCTGGMHRSVYIAKHIFDRLTAQGVLDAARRTATHEERCARTCT